MEPANSPRIGFACAYTPLPLIAAAGFAPFRVLPLTGAPDRTGQLLHDNLCPHVKAILDRALAGDLPTLSGMVFMNSCDAMRRLFDAWKTLPGAAPALLIDLPVTAGGPAAAFFAAELRRLAEALEVWGGTVPSAEGIAAAVARYNDLAGLLAKLAARVHAGTLADGPARHQEAVNQAATGQWEGASARIRELLAEPERPGGGVPLFLFGNVLPDPEAFRLFAACGARITAEDLCSGSRLFQSLDIGGGGDALDGLAEALLSRRPCARTFAPADPLRLAGQVLADARAAGARGVICHTLKFCDPYLARLSAVRRTLQEAGMPFLVLEGDCTLRSMGQQRTRIEAFVEMLR
jgi:benzoyl-CoA reductase/2-hydroxyglutaryl-CoA dehydratase subunit BcrC/BadD/HgdB